MRAADGVDLVDVNVLVYAVNTADARHPQAAAWLGSALAGAPQSVGLPWQSLLGFARLSTRHGILTRPLDVGQAIDVVDAWLAAPAATVVHPTARHTRHLRRLLSGAGRAGDLVADAHLAALALEHGAAIVSFDSDFGRFPGVRWRAPQ